MFSRKSFTGLGRLTSLSPHLFVTSTLPYGTYVRISLSITMINVRYGTEPYSLYLWKGIFLEAFVGSDSGREGIFETVWYRTVTYRTVCFNLFQYSNSTSYVRTYVPTNTWDHYRYNCTSSGIKKLKKKVLLESITSIITNTHVPVRYHTVGTAQYRNWFLFFLVLSNFINSFSINEYYIHVHIYVHRYVDAYIYIETYVQHQWTTVDSRESTNKFH